MSRFRVFSQFNREPLDLKHYRKRFSSETYQHLQLHSPYREIVAALALTPCIKFKEVLESFEIYAACRKRLVNSHVVDLCCGHGLTGLLFAALHPKVERVTLLDKTCSEASQRLFDALCRALPGLGGKVERRQEMLEEFQAPNGDVGFLAIHACGSRTDLCLDVALARQRPVVAVPCCYTGTGKSEPYALKGALGVPVATDVGRTYRLHAAGYDVQWEQIPEAISPMNRVIIAHPSGTSPAFGG